MTVLTMNSLKVLCLIAVLVCANASVVKRQKKVRRICQNPRAISVVGLPCSKSIEQRPISPCNCQNLILEELANGCSCGCIEAFSILNTELSKSGKLIKLPQSVASYEANLPVPVNLPLYDIVIDLPCQTPFVTDFPREASFSYQIIDAPCACRNRPTVEYIPPVELPCPKIKNPYAEAQAYYIETPNYQSQVIQLPGYPIDCGCKSLPCNCQKPCDNGIKVLYGLPGGEAPVNCGCASKYGPLPVQPVSCQSMPCACQNCQLAALDLPVFSCGCPPIPPPEVGCGKYLRQVRLQPPFI